MAYRSRSPSRATSTPVPRRCVGDRLLSRSMPDPNFVPRRSFLRALAAAALAWPVTSRAAARPGVRVIVIGAGVSGLAAAKALDEAGVKVTGLEARERIGGRVHTDRSSFGVAVELGAQYVQGTERNDGSLNPVWEMALQKGWKSAPYSTDAAQALRDGREVDAAALTKLVEAFEAAVDKADVGAAASFETALGAFTRDANLNARQAAELRAMVAAVIGLEYARAIDQISITGSGKARGFVGGNHILTDGFDQVPALLAAALPDVRLGEIVTTVDHGGPLCTVTTTKGEYNADHVICTLPLGVMKARSARFAPALPAAKTQAIARMGMGQLNKVILEFPKRFWSKNVNWLLSLKPSAPWGAVFSDLDGVHPGHNLLVLWQSGSLALRREEPRDDATVENADTEMRGG